MTVNFASSNPPWGVLGRNSPDKSYVFYVYEFSDISRQTAQKSSNIKFIYLMLPVNTRTLNVKVYIFERQVSLKQENDCGYEQNYRNSIDKEKSRRHYRL